MNNITLSRAFSVLALLASVVLVVLGSLRCWKPVPVPARDGGPTAGADGVGGSGGHAGNGGAGGCAAGGPTCLVTWCWDGVFGCGDCLDGSHDGLIDMADPKCLSPCDDTEGALYFDLAINDGYFPCHVDCFFDGDTDPQMDHCQWDHRCDPLAVAPQHPPEGAACAYDPGFVDPYGGTCTEMRDNQPSECVDYCLPIVPNGCDCFGCCELPAESGNYVWLNSEDEYGSWSCEIEYATDPSKCRPCTPVPSCINPCEECEICLGKTDLDPRCGGEQACPNGRQRCGLPCQPACPTDEYCLTGCCTPVPVAPWD